MLHHPRGDRARALEREIDRSRRLRHPAALIRLSPTFPFRDRRHAGGQERTADRLRRLLRTIDEVWTSGRDVYAVLPETDRRGVEALLARLMATAPDLLTSVRIRSACFPEDGLTAEALRSCVHAPATAGRLAEARRGSTAPRPATFDPVADGEQA